MKATVRAASCKCQHCKGKWIVRQGNHSRKAMTWGLAMGYALKITRDQ